MVTFLREEIEERKLEAEILRNPEAVEEGLKVLDHQVPAGNERIDVICVDGGGTLCVLELKVTEDDMMILQALGYYDWVVSNLKDIAIRYKEKYPKTKIDGDKLPRVMLIAPSFSETMLKAAKYVDPSPDFFEYSFLKTQSGERGLYCRPVRVEAAREPYAPPEVEDHVNYIINLQVRRLCKDSIDKIGKLGEGIEVKALKWAIAFKYQGRVLAYIQTKRDFFWVNYPKGPRATQWEWERIGSKKDLRSEIMEGIRAYYSRLRGE